MKEIEVKARVRAQLLAAHFAQSGEMLIPVTVSNRHIHLTHADLETLFGTGAQMDFRGDLMQPGQFACNQTVTIEGPRGTLARVRVLGPERPQTQVEISMTDARLLGIRAPIRMSGDLKGTPGIRIVGPQGALDLASGVIVAMRHCHMSPGQAAVYGAKNGDRLTLHVEGVRPCEMRGFVVRVTEKSELEAHVDVDEANACLIHNDILLAARIEDAKHV